MANNRQSLSEQAQRRGNLILLIIGVVLLLLFLLALCQMPSKKSANTVGEEDIGGYTIVEDSLDKEAEEGKKVSFKPGEGKLVVTPSSVFTDSAVGKKDQVTIVLKAENAPILLLNKTQISQEGMFELSGTCMEVAKDQLDVDEECTMELSWQAEKPEQIKTTLLIEWREKNPRVMYKEKTEIPVNVRVLDSNPCVICKCDSITTRPPDVPLQVVKPDGTPVPVENNTIETPEGPVELPNTPWVPVGKKTLYKEPDYAPLNLKNELIGTVAKNREVLDFDGKVIGRLLNDNTIINENLEILGKAIPLVPTMLENGEVIGNIALDPETKEVLKPIRVVDAKGNVIGHPRVDHQVVDPDGKPLGFLSPWGMVIDFNGNILGGIRPTKDASGKKFMMGVRNDKEQIVAYMRPMGLAVDAAGKLVGGVVPAGVVVGAGKVYGPVKMNGQVYDDLKQHVGHVLLDKAMVDDQGVELGSVVRQGLVINNSGKVVGFINSEGAAVDAKGGKIGFANPDGSVFANDKYVGTVMPIGRVIADACGQVGSVYPDGQVMALDLQNLGHVLPDGTAVSDKSASLGRVAPWGTAIASECQLLGLISLNGTVVSTQGSLVGCITRDKKVQNVKGEIIGMLTPTGIQTDDKNNVIGRIGLDGHIINNKGEIIGCINAANRPVAPPPPSNGVVVNENGFSLGWSLIGGKTYNSMGSWTGDVDSTGKVLDAKHQLVGVVPTSGPVFSDRGEIVGHYNQTSGLFTNAAGESVGRVLPGMSVVNNNGTEILGVLIPQGTVFVNLQGQVLGTLQSDGTLMNEGQEIPAKILANGTMVDEKGKILGGRLPIGPVINALGKYMGYATTNGDFIDETGIKAGSVLANGLVVSEKKVLGKVLPSLSTAVAVDGWLGSVYAQLIEESEQKSYQGQVSDSKGNLVGVVSAFESVLGIDKSIKGVLMPIAPFVTPKGTLLGWGNFQGEINGPDGRPMGSVLPSGLALNTAQQLKGMIVRPTAVVGTLGEYLGHTTSKGELLSDKGEVLAVTGLTRFVYDVQGVLLGQLLPPGVAIDADGKLLGWTRYDGQIEDGTKVIGQVGLDGHVFDSNGQMIGVYIPLGMNSFSDKNQSLGLVDEDGNISNLNGGGIAQTVTTPFVSSKGVLTGLLTPFSAMTSALTKPQLGGVIAPNGEVYSLTSRRPVGDAMTNSHTAGSAGFVDGGILPFGLAISSTLGLLGQVYPDGGIFLGQKQVGAATGTGLVYSLNGELLGGIFTPGVVIDKKGAIVATTGASAAVMSKGKQVGNKMAFASALTTTNKWLGHVMPRGATVNDKGQLVGSISLDGSVINGDNTFVGRILPDGSVAGVRQKSIYNTMPYIGHTIRQGLPLSFKGEILGRTTATGALVDKNNRAMGHIRDEGSVFNEAKEPVGVVLPFISAVDFNGKVMGILSGEAQVVSFAGENKGKIVTNRVVKGTGDFDVKGFLIPEKLIVDDCRVVGQTAYDGRIINGQGAVVGRIHRDYCAQDAQGNVIGCVAKDERILKTTKTGKYMGRVLPDGTAVNVDGVEIACLTNSEDLINQTTGEPPVDPETGEPIGTGTRGVTLKPNGDIAGWVNAQGEVEAGGQIIGIVLGAQGGAPNKIIDPVTGKELDMVVVDTQTTELLWDEKTGKVTLVMRQNGDILTPELILVARATTDGRLVDPNGNEIKSGMNGGWGVLGDYQFRDCELFDRNNQKVATLNPDGKLLDDNGLLFGTVMPDGSVYDAAQQFIDKIKGYKVDLQQCGLTPDEPGRVHLDRGAEWTIRPDGTVQNSFGNEIGYVGTGGRIFGLDGNPLPMGGAERPRPPEPTPVKFNPEDITAINQILAEKRRLMRQGLGGSPLTMSAEMQARFKPKKDKDWSKMGIDKSVSSWPVDMTRVVLQGRAIPAVLARSIDSRYSESGALAIVEANVYAEEGRNIIIPAGSRLIGQFGGSQTDRQGVAKVRIEWTRLVRPDGVSFDLGGSPSGDAMGRGGIAAYLDKQLLRKYGTPLLGTMSESIFLPLYTATSSDKNKSVTVDSNSQATTQTMTEAQRTREQVRQLWIDQMKTISDELVQEFSQVPPVLYVPIGTRLTVLLNKDLWLRSAEDDEEEANEEFGQQGTSALKPKMPSWEQKGRQRLNSISDKPSKSVSAPKKEDSKTKKKEKDAQAKKQAEKLSQPIYDGSNQTQMDSLDDRVVDPVPSQVPPMFK